MIFLVSVLQNLNQKNSKSLLFFIWIYLFLTCCPETPAFLESELGKHIKAARFPVCDDDTASVLSENAGQNTQTLHICFMELYCVLSFLSDSQESLSLPTTSGVIITSGEASSLCVFPISDSGQAGVSGQHVKKMEG